MTAEVNGLNEILIKKLIGKKMKVSAAESCTGGLLSALLTEVSGASAAVEECLVTYSNAVKARELSVSEETLERHTAVSEPTAEQMAYGVCAHTGADLGISITGIAGPTGGTDKTPVGTVFVGICLHGHTDVYELHLSGDRNSVREQACVIALQKAIEAVDEG